MGIKYVDSLTKFLSKEDFEEGELWWEFHKLNEELRKFLVILNLKNIDHF